MSTFKGAVFTFAEASFANVAVAEGLPPSFEHRFADVAIDPFSFSDFLFVCHIKSSRYCLDLF
jgi:hypothetical protein